jgi:hypothetical protein
MTDALRLALDALARRPECVHGLNGPCRECGPSLAPPEALDWQRELADLGVTAADAEDV